ncbi:biopolymer transporter ExbD [Emticicia sp. C21]|uniref:ExbD/TolR family protein n=1 Tax=Emticicia sp. C21 TaxID=2302915 RepID=UPI000E352C5E|nr:biopolymer transporter ExbD [Emticicia sp. C21]RFS13870.1 biopolymer transporter ExbD [Emticicia sp. C21]
MAEIATTTRVARVDMTPMVDLGFLLITFFMFTTTFSSPNMMKLNMPDIIDRNKTIIPEIGESNSINLILGKDDRIFWHQKNYKDLNTAQLIEVNYGVSLRQIILQKRKLAKKSENFTVIIRATDDSNYKNAVDALDEMAITSQERYVLADITPKEKQVYEAKIKL